jgi:hypothetical protein
MTSPISVFDSMLGAIRDAADYNRDDTVPPAAVLWTDERREFERLLPRLRVALPALLTLGPYAPASRTGPAIWLRCVLAGQVPALDIPSDTIPILYLPGVSRPTLRDTEDCPPELRPLTELQYRGVFFSQANSKDWTLAAFLQSEHGGLGLRLAKDAATASSLRRAIERLAEVPVPELASKSTIRPLDSEDFDALIADDPVDDLLTWLSDPKGTTALWEAERFETLSSRCKADYSFDPVRDGELVGAEKLGLHEKPVWRTAWKRFTSAPARYAGLVELLRRAKPQPKPGDLLASIRVESWPQDDEAAEADLRKALHALAAEPVPAARKRLKELEKTHQQRRDWPWARLGRSPLVQAIEHLARLAEATEKPLQGATIDDLVHSYVADGWRADQAASEALATVVTQGDQSAISIAVNHVYAPWLRDAAELFRQRHREKPLPGREAARLGEVPAGTCALFADGLRLDVGQVLKAMLEARGLQVKFGHHTVALPSVTPTAKPAISPVAHRIAGLTPGDEFLPSVAEEGKDLTPDRFRKLLDGEGYQFLAPTEAGNPDGRAWTEFGNLDQTGHKEGIVLARRIPELLNGLAARIESLLAAGWREVRVVTDHGWLLLPGGLPKADLPKYLTETRWGRCAVVRPSATVDFPCFPWSWSEGVRIASPYGIDSFLAGKEYGHGGLSLQECVVPRLSVRGGAGGPAAKIEQAKWAGLRCRTKIAGDVNGCTVDLRDKAADPATSLCGSKPVAKDGTAALVVADDAREGTATNLVLLDASGTVIDKMPVTIGG